MERTNDPERVPGRARASRRRGFAIAGGALLLLGIAYAWQADNVAWLLDGRWSSADELDRVRERLRSAGVWAPLLYVAIVIVEVVVAPIPGMFLYLPGGALFGGALGGTLALAGNTLGAGLAAFLLRRAVSEHTIRGWFDGGRLERVRDLVERRGAWIVLALRLNPLTSCDLVSYAAALTPMRLRTLMLATLVGMAPLCYAQSFLVASIFTALPWLLWPMAALAVAYVFAVIWALRRLAARDPTAPSERARSDP